MREKTGACPWQGHFFIEQTHSLFSEVMNKPRNGHPLLPSGLPGQARCLDWRQGWAQLDKVGMTGAGGSYRPLLTRAGAAAGPEGTPGCPVDEAQSGLEELRS